VVKRIFRTLENLVRLNEKQARQNLAKSCLGIRVTKAQIFGLKS